jgi:hypothetical protein
VNARLQTEPENYDYGREVYSVDGTCVTLDRRGWRCTCSAHASGLRCTHVERAAVFKQMRGVRRADDTIELELTASQLQALSEESVVSNTDPAPIVVPAKPAPLRVSRWAAVTAAVAVAAVSSGITYLATARPQPLPTPAAQVAYALPAPPLADVTTPPDDPVRIVNPFDASEVFEFPAETPESDARAAVAELLMKRAQDRLNASPGVRPLDKTATRKRPMHSARLAQRS